MRYPASEKLEIIRLVEQSHLPTKQTIDKLGIPRTTFYRWYDRYLTGGAEALDEPELSPRELAVRFTYTQRYFVSEASVYRLLKAHDLITSPAFVVIKAANDFVTKPRPSIRCGKPTLPTSRSSAGADIICPPFSTTSHVMWWRGNCVRR